ncbi:MAG TPA: hypothetical protein VJ499_06725 [Flavisolibacter sp.]|nr:hypothetical protein [Flavisolibacter sp.]
MNKEKQRFEEQNAPLKNTDHAFVRVKEDGSPDKLGSKEWPQDRNQKEVTETKEKSQGRH